MYVSMKNMLADANANGYAIMAINCFNIETARSVISAAEKSNAPIIVNIYKDHLLNHCDSALIAPIIKTLADRAKVSVALNLDHGEEKDYILKAIDDGFSSVMVDASRFDIDGNIKMTREVVEYAHARGVSVEGEIGCMGASEGGAFTQDSMYTDPIQAKEFYESTGIDALAISIGTSHGNYPDGMVPKFDIERLKEIKRLTGAPLVLHGGSGSGKENIVNSVKNGINKINVGCDFMNSNRDAAAKLLSENPDINYFDLIHSTEKESSELVRYYIGLSGSEGKNKDFR